MERETTGTAEDSDPASPVRKNMNEETTAANSHSSLVTCSGITTDVARARWTLLRQVTSKSSQNLLLFLDFFLLVFIMCFTLKSKLHINEVWISVMASVSLIRERWQEHADHIAPVSPFPLSCFLHKFCYFELLMTKIKIKHRTTKAGSLMVRSALAYSELCNNWLNNKNHSHFVTSWNPLSSGYRNRAAQHESVFYFVAIEGHQMDTLHLADEKLLGPSFTCFSFPGTAIYSMWTTSELLDRSLYYSWRKMITDYNKQQ